MTTQILIAGFGGQGVLFAGKFIAYKGLIEGKQVSWLPSYGPEMRGGTANCSINVSDTPVGSPIVATPDVLMVMNLPSMDKYENSVVSGGILLADSSLIERKAVRKDIKTFYIPATKMAQDSGFPTLANMIMTGKLLRECEDLSYEFVKDALKKVVSAKHADLFDVNLRAIETGYNYKDGTF